MTQWGQQLPTRQELYDQKKDSIVSQATRFFSQSGYTRTSLADVAAELGVTKQALYYYFKDKQELMYACADAALLGALACFPSAEEQKNMTPLETLRVLLNRYIIHVIEGNFQFVMFLDVVVLKPEQAQQIQGYRDEFEQLVRNQIEHGIREGSFRAGNVKMMSFALLGAVNWIARWYKPEGELPLEETASEVVDCALLGIVNGESTSI